MPRIDVADDLTDWMALQPKLAAPLSALAEAVYGDTPLTTREREIARMRIAEANECQVCRLARVKSAPAGMDESFYRHVLEWRSYPGYSERERLAAEFAEKFATNHVALREDDEFWQRMRGCYSDEEIVALGISCSMWLGSGRLMRVLDLAQSCSLSLPA